MTRYRLVKRIMEDVGVDKQTATAMVESLEDTVMEVIALDDSIEFRFGTISGYLKEPWRITGYYATLAKPERRGGWSVAKDGTPKIEWSREAKWYGPIDPGEYFSWPENKYGKKARQYRKDLGLPELTEFDGMTEEEIDAFCEKFDKEKRGPISPNREKFEERHKRMYKKAREDHDKRLIEEDLQRQRDEGVPEDQLVRHTKDECVEILKEKWRSIQHREKWYVKRDSHY